MGIAGGEMSCRLHVTSTKKRQIKGQQQKIREEEKKREENSCLEMQWKEQLLKETPQTS